MSSGSGSGPPTSPCSQNEPPSTRKYSSLNSAIAYQSGRAGSSRYGACQASIARAPGRRLGEGVPREVDRARAGPAPRLRVALPPAPAGAELDDRQVPGDREPDRPPLAGRQHERRRDRRARRPIRWPTALRWPAPGLQPPVGGEVGPKLPVGDRIERRARAQLHAVAAQCRDRERAAQGGRRVVGGVAELHGERASPSATTRWGRGAAGPVAANGSAQVNRSPTVNGSGPGFSDPPLEHPDGQGAPLEVAGR